MSDLKSQLAEQVGDSQWTDLVPHARRDALIVVNESLDIVDVGVALANDNASLVQRWISEQLIHKPSFEELSTWNSNPEQSFNTLIVQPFVLITKL